MDDYIEREVVREAFRDEFDNDYADDITNKLPAADVVPVVRCKDCLYCGFCGDSTNLEIMGFYGYCSRGKRDDGRRDKDGP